MISQPLTISPQVGFVGAGAIGRCHVLALAMLPFYYSDGPRVKMSAVTATTAITRNAFASRYGFETATDPEAFWLRNDIDTVFVLTPNARHCEHTLKALAMSKVSRVYIEKPLCVTREESNTIADAASAIPDDRRIRIQVGFQFLQMPAIREAWRLWRDGVFGRPVHFTARYLHSGYLDENYRQNRGARLLPAPAGGATVDLGSHALSLLVAFLGEGLEVIEARQSGGFPDVSKGSDMCAIALVRDPCSGAVGCMTASRVSVGADDLLELEIRCEKGGFRVSTETPDLLQILKRRPMPTCLQNCGNDYGPSSQFPSAGTASGWLRSLVHAHHLFFGDGAPEAGDLVPDLPHALAVQRLVMAIADRIGPSK